MSNPTPPFGSYGPPSPPQKKTHHWYRPRNVILILTTFILTIVIIAIAAASSSSPKTTNHVQAGSVQPAATQPAYTPTGVVSAPADPDPTTAAPTTPAPTTPALTASQQQAIESAQSYLDNLGGFSEEGLLKQLTSSYGEGFSQADAQFAINYLHPDWYQQAVESAKSYISDGMGFSKAGLYQQLTSSYGEGFTAGQANYALTQVGM